MKSNIPFISKLQTDSTLFSKAFLFLLFSLITIRVLELALGQLSFTPSISHFFGYAINFDSINLTLISIPVFLIFILFSSANKRLGTFILIFSLSLIEVFNLVLTSYYMVVNEPLTLIVFQFSFTEILEISSGEVQSRNGLLFALILHFILFVWGLIRITKSKSRKFDFTFVIIFAILILASLANIKTTTKSLKFFDTKTEYHYYNSKVALFFDDYHIQDDLFEIALADQIEYIQTFQVIHNKHQIDKIYPLYNDHKFSNTLGKWFEKSKTPPNIVLILSEGLSSSIVGPNAMYNLTPTTDSLAQNGLSWNHFMSNAEKTYGALPNILASLPSTLNKRGFINLVNEENPNYPRYHSLVDILNANGYSTEYYYGGWGGFDNILSWVKNSNFQTYYDQHRFDSTFQSTLKEKQDEDDHIWGFDDSVLFEQSLQNMDNNSKTPFFKVIQTLSYHSPFNLASSKYYDRDYLNSRLAKQGINLEQIHEITDKEVSVIFFADDAVKYFLERFKEYDAFENTIFIITGDHAMQGGLIINPIDNYQIPLIIYSPLLTGTAEFNSVSSHNDITPTLVSLLNHQFGLETPPTNHWFGAGLDTTEQFRISHPIFFNLGRPDLPIALFPEGMIYMDKLFPLTNDFKLNLKGAKDIDATLELKIKSLEYINNYIIQQDKIVPPNVKF